MDILATLCDLTDDKTWREVQGPASRSGIDYWFENDNADEAYCNDDNGYVTISVQGDIIFEGEE